MTKRIDILKRQQKGTNARINLKELLLQEKFNSVEIEFMDLSESDIIIEKVKNVFPFIQHEMELISSINMSFKNSLLLNEVFNQLKPDSLCYLYTSNFDVIGLLLLNAKKAFEHCLQIAKRDEENTCFLLDEKFRYSFTINYYDGNDNDNQNKFDVQRKRNLN